MTETESWEKAEAEAKERPPASLDGERKQSHVDPGGANPNQGIFILVHGKIGCSTP